MSYRYAFPCTDNGHKLENQPIASASSENSRNSEPVIKDGLSPGNHEKVPMEDTNGADNPEKTAESATVPPVDTEVLPTDTVAPPSDSTAPSTDNAVTTTDETDYAQVIREQTRPSHSIRIGQTSQEIVKSKSSLRKIFSSIIDTISDQKTWTPEMCINSLRSSSINTYIALRKKLKSCSGEWFLEFLEQDGLDVLLQAVDTLSVKRVSQLTDAMLLLEVVTCVKEVMNAKTGLEYMISQPEYLHKLLRALDTPNVVVKKQLFELLSALCVYSEEGLIHTIQSFDKFKVIKNQRYRFSIILHELRTSSLDQYTATILAFINCLINGHHSVEDSSQFRQEFTGLGLLDVLETLKDIEDDSLQIQLYIFYEEKQKDEVVFGRPSSLDLDIYSPPELFQALFQKVYNTPQVDALTGLLQSLYQVNPDDRNSDLIWDLAETLVQKATHVETIGDAERLLGKASVPLSAIPTDQVDAPSTVTFAEHSSELDDDSCDTVDGTINAKPIKFPFTLPFKTRTSSSGGSDESDSKPVATPPGTLQSSLSKSIPSSHLLPEKDGEKSPVAAAASKATLLSSTEDDSSSLFTTSSSDLSTSITESSTTEENVPVMSPYQLFSSANAAESTTDEDENAAGPSSVKSTIAFDGKMPPTQVISTVGAIQHPAAASAPSPPPPMPTSAIPPAPPPPSGFIPEAPPLPGGAVPALPPVFHSESSSLSSLGSYLPPYNQQNALQARGTPKPKRKMKSINWSKIPAHYASDRNSIWKKVNELQTPVKINYNNLDELFCQPTRGSTGSLDGSFRHPSVSITEVNLLDMTRSMTVNICLRQFKTTNEEILDMIREGNADVIGIEKLRGLMKILPQREEVELVSSYRGDIEALGNAEQFYLQLLTVPAYSTRLEGMLLSLEFHVQYDRLLTQLRNMIKAGKGILRSQSLQKFLWFALQVGNYINAGGYAGNAVGFKFSSLIKLADMRANKARVTLLHFLVDEAEKQDTELLSFSTELDKPLQSTARIVEENLETEMKLLGTNIDKLEIQLGKEAASNPDLIEQFGGFITKAKDDIKTLEKKLIEVQKLSDDLALLWCEDPKKFKLEDFLLTFRTFTEKVTQCKKDNENRKLQEERAARRKKQMELEKEKKASTDKLASGPKQTAIIDDLLNDIKTGTAPRRTRVRRMTSTTRKRAPLGMDRERFGRELNDVLLNK